jgi:hypothetical protein
MVPAEKIPEHWPPITNGPASTVHSATAQPEGGAQDIVTQERMWHSEGIFLTKPENSLPGESNPGLGGATRKSLTTRLEALSRLPWYIMHFQWFNSLIIKLYLLILHSPDLCVHGGSHYFKYIVKRSYFTRRLC